MRRKTTPTKTKYKDLFPSEVAATEERERAAADTAATAARAARLAMAELAAAAADPARAAAAELDALRSSSISISSSVSVDGGTDDELKLAREAAQEQATQWAAVHHQGRSGGSPDGRGALHEGVRAAAVPPTTTAAQTGVDAPVAGSTETAAFIGGATLPRRTGTMVIAGPRPLSGTSVLALGGLPSPRPTTSSGPQ
jgi:hypothetical protein